MFASFASASLHGIDAFRVDVEVDVSGGLPQYIVVGLPATAVKEGATRIRSALHNCGQDFPARKITVNLAPADRRKDGAAFDLPIAAGVVVAAGTFVPDVLGGLMLVGELGLDGAVRPVRGVLAAASLAREHGLRGIVVPRACAAEAAVVPELEVHPIDHLVQVLRAMEGTDALPRWDRSAAAALPGDALPPTAGGDFADVRGQESARHAVEVAVAGGHNVLLYGPPGIGKTMIARRLPTILPPMSRDESIEVTRIYSAAGMSPPTGLVTRRPFRAPHHTVSTSALVGGGSAPRPGEISLAHRGVLFLDELPEFPRPAIEALRQPLEDRCVRIGRVQGSTRLPASFLLAASANPCACGWHGSGERQCTCALSALERYRARISGPILDRIDIQVRVGAVTLAEMRGSEQGESSAAIRARVEAARERQLGRLSPYAVRVNAEMPVDVARITCRLTARAEAFLGKLFARRTGVTARGLDRMIRVARTVADLRDADTIDEDDIRDAAQMRALENDPLTDPRDLCARELPTQNAKEPTHVQDP